MSAAARQLITACARECGAAFQLQHNHYLCFAIPASVTSLTFRVPTFTLTVQLHR